MTVQAETGMNLITMSDSGMGDMHVRKQSGGETHCPFIGREYEMCYISQLTSQVIPKILQYCAGNYENCPVYKTLTTPSDS